MATQGWSEPSSADAAANPKVNRALEGKLAIVTGASRGIGAAISENLAEKGAKLVLSYTSESSAAKTAELAQRLGQEYGTSTLIVQADLGTKEGPKILVDGILKNTKGDLKIDILINNAGVSYNTPLEKITIEDFDWQYRVNVLGPLLLTQACIPYLPNDRSGRIVNLSSVSSSAGFHQQTVYGGTKAALEAMTRTWANELAERATVNAINPGPVKTDMWAGTTPQFKKQLSPYIKITPGSAIRPGVDDQDLVDDAEVAGGRPAYVQEVAGVVGMLCTKDAGWCTGQVVCANGGMRMST